MGNGGASMRLYSLPLRTPLGNVPANPRLVPNSQCSPENPPPLALDGAAASAAGASNAGDDGSVATPRGERLGLGREYSGGPQPSLPSLSTGAGTKRARRERSEPEHTSKISELEPAVSRLRCRLTVVLSSIVL